MDNGNCLCDTPGNGKAVQEVVDDVQMVSKVTYLLVNIKGLGEDVYKRQLSGCSVTAQDITGFVKLGHPQPESNLSAEVKSGSPVTIST